MTTRPNTTNDFMRGIAQALRTGGDHGLQQLEDLDRFTSGWMVDRDERNAITDLLEAAAEAIERGEG